MKQKRNKFFAVIVMLISSSAMALSTDAEQPIYIDSDSQNLDMTTNTVIFTGNVYLRQGSIRLNADKVVVTRPSGQEGAEIIDAYGKPATFEQTLDDGKKINGEALDLQYETAKSFLTMTNRAVLTQEGGNQVEGQKITYNIDKQLLVAESDSSSRVTTVLQPQTKQDKK
ncbi:lipopolysaccharide transport periplasmic protein LptA [Enterovibrio norvegicus FF-33]|uniref:Lipopolysaccharide export system protein LptA n=1 Tax=Enterovibrio norvegicus FF-454 TaxID=1185651 RepID=A0A1E5BYG7_9GAMM|nr:lipopolysaccharide transport periplasmic protein LptA [Enterovibrio norvegicus]OEE57952.1 lipopolysaccharide transport periplasmic protein LptA [Enterovibrio norvegicus FF-454]OEE70591.1 lipopolysaccharide transport periplasmic protein LptA [Enterovibrio norvegicus FF-33]OEE90412.1 lipopolysaccharide transport periplasmic protein LptA [Enterovibrio norvegicus FF-162]